jgi:nucleoid-associated protein YgaU
MQKMAARLAAGTPKEKDLASVELEAIGSAAAPYLESAATSGDDWTALYAAQALSYLENPKGPDRMYSLADSQDEAVRYEAVRFIGQLAGRRAVQALRDKINDASNRVALEAVKGLVMSGEGAASEVRLSRFDMVAVPGAEPGILVKSTGRPMVVIAAPGTPLKGPIAITMPDIGIGSVDDRNVAITTGEGPNAQTIQVEATADNILAILAQSNPPFAVIRKTITALEDARNTPYKVRYLD